MSFMFRSRREEVWMKETERSAKGALSLYLNALRYEGRLTPSQP